VKSLAKTDRKSDRTPRLDRHIVCFHAKQHSSDAAAVKHGGRSTGRGGNANARRNRDPASFGRSENRSSRSVFRGPSGQERI
jgi:hypothetical protein